MGRAEAAAKQWARERPDLPVLPEMVGRLLDAAARDHLNPAAFGIRPECR